MRLLLITLFCITISANISSEPIVFTIEFANADVVVDGAASVVVDISAQIFADTNNIIVGGGILGGDRYSNITSVITIAGIDISLADIPVDFGFLDLHPADIITGLPLNNFILTSANLTDNIVGVGINGLSQYDGVSNFDRTASDLVVVSTGLAFAALDQTFLVTAAEEMAFTAQLQAVPEPGTYFLLFVIGCVFYIKKRKIKLS